MSSAMLLLMLAAIEGQAEKDAAARPGPPPPWIVKNSRAFTFYYREPQPALGPKMMRELLEKETVEHPWFQARAHVLDIIATQLGLVAAGVPESVRQYELAYAQATEKGQRVVLRALRHCGDAETAKAAAKWLESEQRPAIRQELTELLAELEAGRKRQRDRAAATPAELDFLWADFFISGEYAPVERIIDAADDAGGATRPIQSAARWSLESNLRQHTRLRELVVERLEAAPADRRALLQELLDKSDLRFPQGVFVASRQPDWRLEFDGQGLYRVIRGGELAVEGTYRSQGDVVTLVDEKGPLATADPMLKTGRYRWRLVNRRLQFLRVDDKSRGRELMLTTNVWSPAPAP